VWNGNNGAAIGVVNQGWYNKFANGRIELLHADNVGFQIGDGFTSANHGTVIEAIDFFGPATGSGTGIKLHPNSTLHEAVITNCNFKRMNIGVDLSTGTLGERNTIQIKTDNVESNTVTDAIKLPATWNKSNRIEVNGLVIRGSITNASNDATMRMTSTAHGLLTNDKIGILGVRRTGGTSNANTTFGVTKTITKIDDNVFELNGTAGQTGYVSGTGYWGVWAADVKPLTQ
jgi:hypothetical protein